MIVTLHTNDNWWSLIWCCCKESASHTTNSIDNTSFLFCCFPLQIKLQQFSMQIFFLIIQCCYRLFFIFFFCSSSFRFNSNRWYSVQWWRINICKKFNIIDFVTPSFVQSIKTVEIGIVGRLIKCNCCCIGNKFTASTKIQGQTKINHWQQ